MIGRITRSMRSVVFAGIAGSIIAVSAAPAQAALSSAALGTDLNNLVLKGNTLVATLNITTLTSLGSSSQLLQLESSVASYQQSVLAVYNSVAGATGTFSVSNDVLMALQNLAAINTALSVGLQGLSVSVVTLKPTMFLSTFQSSQATILRLSDDIGEMANRILDMANKILVMADNIGLMADRILATQIIQSANLKVIVDAVLQTQVNMILLSATL